MDWIWTFLPMGSSSVKTLPQVLILQAEKNCSFSQAVFFQKSISPNRRKGWRNDLLYQKLIRKYEDDETTNTEDSHFASFNSSLA